MTIMEYCFITDEGRVLAILRIVGHSSEEEKDGCGTKVIAPQSGHVVLVCRRTAAEVF